MEIDTYTGGGGNTPHHETADVNDDQSDKIAYLTVSTNNTKNALIDETTADANVNILDESKYAEWTTRQVLLWLKNILEANSFEDQLISAFLNEFSTKHINGHALHQLKNNESKIDHLKADFAKENQVFGMWLVVTTSILSIGGNGSTTHGDAGDKYLD